MCLQASHPKQGSSWAIAPPERFANSPTCGAPSSKSLGESKMGLHRTNLRLGLCGVSIFCAVTVTYYFSRISHLGEDDLSDLSNLSDRNNTRQILAAANGAGHH